MTSPNDNQTLRLDVRPVLQKGVDPFQEIMAARQQLKPGQSLELVAPFEPVPLISLFTNQGFSACSEQRSDSEWIIRFTPTSSNESAPRELDLRNLEPPAPLQKALEAIAALGRDDLLILHTRFRPVHLFEQLEEGAFDYDCEEQATHHWITHLWRISH